MHAKIENIFDKDAAKSVVWYTFICMFIAHAYRYMNLGYTDDSVEIVQNTDKMWQFELGRFLQPVYWEFRGDIVAPYLIGVLSALWLSVAIYLIVRMMGIQKHTSIAVLCAVLSSNTTLSFANATYVSWSDVYMLAFMCAVIGVWLWHVHKYGFILGAGFICASLALYQAYFQAAVLIYLMVLIKRALDGEKVKTLFWSGICAIISLLLALVMYDAAVGFLEMRLGIERAAGYNGIGRAGDFMRGNLLEQIKNTYCYPFTYMSELPVQQPKITTILYCILLGITMISLVVLIWSRRIGWMNAAFICAMLIIMPLGGNCIYFISGGLSHALMIYSYFLFFCFSIYILEKLDFNTSYMRWYSCVARGLGLTLLVITCYNHVVYANQLYIRRDLEFQSTLSVMTRVIDRAEQVEGYTPGSTPVAMIGTMYNSPLAMERPGFEHLAGKDVAMNNNYYATSMEEFYPWYFWQILGYPFNLVGEFERAQIANEPDVRAQPVFPADGCCRIRDGVLVIKLGEVYQGE